MTGPAGRSARRCRLGRIRSPAIASTAGVRVIAMSTATATPAAAATPSAVRKGMPATERPSSAMMTVRPAKTTALPLVAVARAMDSRTPRPDLSCSWCRLTMKRV